MNSIQGKLRFTNSLGGSAISFISGIYPCVGKNLADKKVGDVLLWNQAKSDKRAECHCGF